MTRLVRPLHYGRVSRLFSPDLRFGMGMITPPAISAVQVSHAGPDASDTDKVVAYRISYNPFNVLGGKPDKIEVQGRLNSAATWMGMGTDTVADGQEYALGWVSTTTISTRQNEFRIRGRKGSKAWSDWSNPFEAELAGQQLFFVCTISSNTDTILQLTDQGGDDQFDDGAVDFTALLARINKNTNQHSVWGTGGTGTWETWGNTLTETEARSHSVWLSLIHISEPTRPY